MDRRPGRIFVALKDSEDAQMDVACVITDLEMPLMDGHRLTKLIKTDDKLKEYTSCYILIIN